MRGPPDNGGGRDAPRRPGRNTQTITTTEEAISETVARPANVIALADARRWRVQTIEAGAGPWWGSYLLRSASWAEASRSRWAA